MKSFSEIVKTTFGVWLIYFIVGFVSFEGGNPLWYTTLFFLGYIMIIKTHARINILEERINTLRTPRYAHEEKFIDSVVAVQPIRKQRKLLHWIR